MIIDKNLFDECWCPVPAEIARVCLSGATGIPKELEDYGREKDGNAYDCSCFSIDIMIENGKPIGGVINYMAEHKMIGESDYWRLPLLLNFLETYGHYKNIKIIHYGY